MENIIKGHRYIIQLSIKRDSFYYNLWDYIESVKTLKEAKDLCNGLYDDSVHKLQISDLVKNEVIETWG